MDWWQIVLIYVVFIAAGGIIGALLSYLILRFVKKRETTFLDDLILRFVKKPEATSSSDLTLRTGKKPEAPSVIEERLKSIVPELLAEAKHNRKIATEPLVDKLLPFQTHVWDARQYEAYKLPSNLRYELEQVYTDIRLANSLAWLSTEFSRRTPSLDENYKKLRNGIAERLDRIKSLIEQSGK